MRLMTARVPRSRVGDVPLRPRHPRHAGRPARRRLSAVARAQVTDDVRREVFLHLTEQMATQREEKGVREEDVLRDFAARARLSWTRRVGPWGALRRVES